MLSSSGHLNLKAQNADIRAVVNRGILWTFLFFCTREDFSYSGCISGVKTNDRTYIRRSLTVAAHDLKKSDIEQRLSKDDEYAHDLSQIVSSGGSRCSGADFGKL